MGYTRGEPDEIELTAIGVELDGSRRVQEEGRGVVARLAPQEVQSLHAEARGNIMQVGEFLDSDRLTTRTPHGSASYVWGAQAKPMNPHRGVVDRLWMRALGTTSSVVYVPVSLKHAVSLPRCQSRPPCVPP